MCIADQGALGPTLDDVIAQGKNEKSNTRFSLSPSAVSTLPEYGYASLDQPPPFSKWVTHRPDKAAGPHDNVVTEKVSADNGSDIAAETMSSHGTLRYNSSDGFGSVVEHAI